MVLILRRGNVTIRAAIGRLGPLAANTKSRILVVDDDPSVADTISAVLCRVGFNVATFYDPLLAVRHALQSEPNVVITDYSMPNMNGLELAAIMQKRYPACKLVILTGQVALVAEYPANGLKFTLLQKPVPPLTLIDAIQ
jgi:DNA-binding NtrC family response regulator